MGVPQEAQLRLCITDDMASSQYCGADGADALTNAFGISVSDLTKIAEAKYPDTCKPGGLYLGYVPGEYTDDDIFYYILAHWLPTGKNVSGSSRSDSSMLAGCCCMLLLLHVCARGCLPEWRRRSHVEGSSPSVTALRFCLPCRSLQLTTCCVHNTPTKPPQTRPLTAC